MIEFKCKILIVFSLCLFHGVYSQRSTLNLSRKNLKEIPESVYQRKDLKVLKLYGNQIDSISPRIAELIDLEKLYLGKNKLKTLPSEIALLKKLKVLSISNNLITSLPNEIGEMESLEQIWANQNQISKIPDSISKLKKLTVLNLNFNDLDTLNPLISRCDNLQFIELSNNHLVFIPNSIGEMKRLKELKLVNAGLMLTLPESICRIRNLELLIVDGNAILPTCLFVNQANRLKLVIE